MAANKKLLVVQVAAWSRGLALPGLEVRSTQTVLPAVTCTVQATFRTASLPAEHGMVANGVYCRRLRRVMFWEQSSALVAGERIWHGFRARGGKVAMLFWQQSMGEDADLIVSPSPLHRHHGGMIQDLYVWPPASHDAICDSPGGKAFKLRRYWGPMASAAVGDSIVDMTADVLRRGEMNLCLTYLPSMDYDLQRHDPAGPKADAARAVAQGQLSRLLTCAREEGYDVLAYGDYDISPVRQAVLPNVALAAAGLLKLREVSGMLYPDFNASDAFAMVDHQVAHVHIRDASRLDSVRAVLAPLSGVHEVLDAAALRQRGLAHANSGELVLMAAQGAWLAYPWWTDKRQQPEYAGHVDIHNKPGYDPCELFWGWPPGTAGRDVRRIRGSHGLAGEHHPVAWASSLLLGEPVSIVDLAAAVRQWLSS